MKNSILLILFCSTVFTGYSQDEFKIGSFDKLKIGTGVEVMLVEGEEGTVFVDSRGVDGDDIIVEKSRGVLTIKTRNRMHFRDRPGWWKVEVTLPVKDLEELIVSTGAVVKSKHVIEGDVMYIFGTTGAEVDIKIRAKSLEVKSNLGATVKVAGKVRYLEALASTGGELDAFYLTSQYAYVRGSMGAVINVYATDEAEVISNMGAEVDIRGRPDHISRKRSFGGVIR